MRIRKQLSKQRGDTIIEVLLAMSVIGLVLGSSYAIANRSLGIGRTAQERTEALKQVETQLERLRTASAVDGNVLVDFPTTGAFCIDDNVAIVSFPDDPVSIPDVTGSTDSINYPASGECNTGTDGRYGLTITRNDDYLFIIRARWEKLGGGLLEELQAQYRIYPAGNTAFQTLLPPPPGAGVSVPELDATVGVASVSRTSATFDGIILSNGGGTIDRMGFVYMTSPGQDPATGTFVDATVGDIGPFSASTSDLVAGTTYYVRAFAQNEGGIGYSDESSEAQFTTDPPVNPVLAWAGVQNIQTDSAVANATIVDDGGAPITSQGVIVQRLGTASDQDGGGTPGGSPFQVEDQDGGDIDVTITGLLPDTNYIVYAYATNSSGTTTTSATAATFRTASIPASVPITPIGSSGSSTYYLSTVAVTWDEAQDFATQSGGHLVAIGSQQENDFILNFASGQRIWIGFTDRQEEGNWQWVTGEEVTYTNWDPNNGEPNDWENGVPGEDVAVMNWIPGTGNWNDWFDFETALFVIEYPEAR